MNQPRLIVPQQRPTLTLDVIRQAGQMAYRLGKTGLACPYAGGTDEAKVWCEGFADAKRSKQLRFDVPLAGQLRLRMAVQAGYRNRRNRISL